MINPRLKDLVARTRNPDLDVDKSIQEQKEKARKRKNLVKKINLKPLEHTMVHTSTLKDYKTLMRVYELGGWKWIDGMSPTLPDDWSRYGKKTGIYGCVLPICRFTCW